MIYKITAFNGTTETLMGYLHEVIDDFCRKNQLHILDIKCIENLT